MNPEDREILMDIRGRLHGAIMAAGQLEDQALYRQIEHRIDEVLTWLYTITKRGKIK